MFLNKVQKEYFENFINKMSDKDKNFNICEECGEKLDMNFTHNYIYLQDTGVCSICKETKEVINPKIANEILSKGINPFDYFYSNCIRIVTSQKGV